MSFPYVFKLKKIIINKGLIVNRINIRTTVLDPIPFIVVSGIYIRTYDLKNSEKQTKPRTYEAIILPEHEKAINNKRESLPAPGQYHEDTITFAKNL